MTLLSSRSQRVILLLAAGLIGWSILEAGSLEPPGAPAPTMQALDSLPSTWKELFMPVQRFDLVMNDEAVLDRETGLVWEREPAVYHFSWSSAVYFCYDASIGNRMGWRLPTFEELTTLVDPGTGSLPLGHPFIGTLDYKFWSLTTSPIFNGNFLVLDLEDRSPPFRTEMSVLQDGHAWCVRGGQGHNPRSCNPNCT